MHIKKAIVVVAAVLAIPAYAALASLSDGQAKLTKAEKVQGVEVASRFRHTHRHCHITITWGHATRRCHTHRHNKVAHHGIAYH